MKSSHIVWVESCFLIDSTISVVWELFTGNCSQKMFWENCSQKMFCENCLQKLFAEKHVSDKLFA